MGGGRFGFVSALVADFIVVVVVFPVAVDVASATLDSCDVAAGFFGVV